MNIIIAELRDEYVVGEMVIGLDGKKDIIPEIDQVNQLATLMEIK